MMKRLIAGMLCIGFVLPTATFAGPIDAGQPGVGDMPDVEMRYGDCPPLLEWLCGK